MTSQRRGASGRRTSGSSWWCTNGVPAHHGVAGTPLVCTVCPSASQIDLPGAWRIRKADNIDFLVVVIGTFLGVIFDPVVYRRCTSPGVYCVSFPLQIDLPEAWRIWKTDKIDFLVVIGTFLGVIFESVEIGLLVGVALSMFKILVQVTRPQLTVLGEVPGVSVYSSVNQYKYAKENPGILVLRVDAPIYFTNANYLREKTLTLATKYEAHHDDEPLTVSLHHFPFADSTVTSPFGNSIEVLAMYLPLRNAVDVQRSCRLPTVAASDSSPHSVCQRPSSQHVVLDLTPVTDIDTTGIHSLTELLSALRGMDVQVRRSRLLSLRFAEPHGSV